MTITSADVPVNAATQSTKQRWNFSASSVAKISPRWSCEGVPSRNGRNRRRRSSFFWPNQAMSTNVSAPASIASRHNSRFSSSGYSTFQAWRGSGKSLKWFRKTAAFAECFEFRCGLRHRNPPPIESEDHNRFSTLCFCHALPSPDCPGVPTHEHCTRTLYLVEAEEEVRKSDDRACFSLAPPHNCFGQGVIGSVANESPSMISKGRRTPDFGVRIFLRCAFRATGRCRSTAGALR
jgi:hypothetical protein